MAMSGLAQVLDGMQRRWTSHDGSHGYRAITETVGPDEPPWQPYRAGWSGTRAKDYREALDREFADETISGAWMSQNDPAGFSIGFGPDRSAGRVSTESDGGQ